MKTLLLAATALLCLPAAAQVYKCPDAGGKTVIQQTPCAGGKAMDVRPASGSAAPAVANDAQLRLQKLKADNQMAEAIRRGEPLVGMTREQLTKAMGAPTKVNASNYQGMQQEQNIYERPDATWYVYTRSGLVESIQHRPGAPIGQVKRPPCPTPHELRDASVSASSSTASRDAIMRYQALLDAERDCKR